MRSEIDVLTPQSLDEALGILRDDSGGLRIIAGGSDVIVQLRDGVIKPQRLLNILLLKELRFIRKQEGRIHIGALATYNDVATSPVTRTHAWPLVEASRQIGAIQLQNTATLGGNLGNASPAADSLPPLYALDAVVVTRNKAGIREIPIEEFYVAYRKTALRPDELIVEVHFRALGENDRGAYKKLGLRLANAISIVDVATVLRGRSSDEAFEEARVALGAVAPTIKRARACEETLTRGPITNQILKDAAALAVEDSVPIDDIRGSAEYRKDVVASLVYEALEEALYG
ncbi:MAG TPA: xanthine dehydrogenase family protein subunit M [archaeon]|nr:xanthine dehydrogenase family protein subunit M [archaeon]